MSERSFKNLFRVPKPIIGMIHLAGENRKDRTKRALHEMALYEAEEINGAIIEDYHGNITDIHNALNESRNGKFSLIRGVNYLKNPYASFSLASVYDASFIQFDSVQTPSLDVPKYNHLRDHNSKTLVLGGVGFKYQSETGNPLWQDLAKGRGRCDAIVTTGKGTGIETPLDKLQEYKTLLGNFPLVVGAGVTAENVAAQLAVADGAIVGSYFKPNGNTELSVDRSRVRDLMDIVRDLRRK